MINSLKTIQVFITMCALNKVKGMTENMKDEKDIKSNEEIMKNKINTILKDLDKTDEIRLKHEERKKRILTLCVIIEIIIILYIIL